MTMQNFLDFYKPSDNFLEFDTQESIAVVLRILDTLIKQIRQDSIYFEDNCGGIEPGLIEEIIARNNAGLGIKMSQDIVAKHHKNLTISSTDTGTCFKIF